MSIKEEGYLHDYIAVGLIGFAVGIAAGSAAILQMINFAAASQWGQVIGLGVVAGIFGYLPGGFVAGYLNFRMHKTDGGVREGLVAGIMAFLAHFFITLFVFVAIAACFGAFAGTIMVGWALTFVWGLIFYPIGGYLAGMIENRAIPMLAFLKFQGAPPPPPPPGAQVCPTCGGPLTYVEQYQRWYCYRCKKYA